MRASYIVFALTAAALASSSLAQARATGDEEVVATATRTKLPTADEVAKAKADAQATQATPAVNTKDQVIAWLADTPKARGDEPVSDTAPQPDNRRQSLVHGSAGVSIGTGGYRSAYVSAVMPVGDNGMLGIAYSQTDFGKNSPYGYGYGYGGYGRGYGDYGRVSRGGTARSFGLSYSADDGDSTAGTPAGCAPGFQDGDRYLEPLWVTRMHGDRPCDAGDAH